MRFCNKNLFLISLSFLFLGILGLKAQQKRVTQIPHFDKRKMHWGFYLGTSFVNYKFDYIPSEFPDSHVVQNGGTGFNIGLIGDLKLNEHFDLRLEPGLISHETELTFKGYPNTPPEGYTVKAEATYFHIPLLVKYRADRYRNVRPYIIGGLSADLNFTSNESSKEGIEQGVLKMDTLNFMLETGVGCDIYFPFFKFSPSLRIQNSLMNQIKPDFIYTVPIESMKSRAIFVCLAFE